jgi:hypothetical protein
LETAEEFVTILVFSLVIVIGISEAEVPIYLLVNGACLLKSIVKVTFEESRSCVLESTYLLQLVFDSQFVEIHRMGGI